MMFRLILLILLVLFVLAFKFLDWWVLLLIGGTIILLSKFLAKRAILWLFSMPFRAKGKVLRKAAVEVHSIRATAPPVEKQAMSRVRLADESRDADADNEGDESGDDDADVPRDYYEIDVTITPAPSTGPFHFWDFTEVTLVAPGKRWDEEDRSCRVESVDLVREGSILLAAGEKADEDDGTKVGGPRRLRMRIGAKPEVRELVFSYYFEKFGKLRLTEVPVPKVIATHPPKNFP